jgi:diaminohydroxyphosphoribosylaminopyrimidine deaminase / 5-amino-6-(5-phosphoribosylamino)uracil reductase
MLNTEELIRKTFELAKKGQGNTWPNPLVGAVLLKDGRIIGEGYHRRHGAGHAEVDCIDNCKESPAGATIYVNLEPCCHTNKLTPPCAQRLIEEKIQKVVICNLDPNPSVNGKGVELLRSHGIEVEHGVLAEEGERLNEAFFFAQRMKRPFVHLKLATTLDGKISMPDGQSQWISNEKSRQMVHEMRSLHQGVIIGAETVRKDNPKLNVRLPDYAGKQPYRIVFTQSGKLPPEAQLFNDELRDQTLVYSHQKLSMDFPYQQVGNLSEALQDLFEKKFMNLMLEGGSSLASSFLAEKLVNRVSLFMNPSFLGEGKSALGNFGLTQLNQRPHLKQIESRWIEDDLFLSGRLE